MTIRRILAQFRAAYGPRRLVAELVGGPVCVLVLALVMAGVAVILP